MSRIENPESRLDLERYWMVSRTVIIEEHYFDDEREAREFAKARGSGFRVDPPVCGTACHYSDHVVGCPNIPKAKL